MYKPIVRKDAPKKECNVMKVRYYQDRGVFYFDSKTMAQLDIKHKRFVNLYRNGNSLGFVFRSDFDKDSFKISVSYDKDGNPLRAVFSCTKLSHLFNNCIELVIALKKGEDGMFVADVGGNA
jgi:hypothetical protein